jgi:DNA-binding XRE family transcriptional regulator
MSKNEPTKICRQCGPHKKKPLTEFAIINRSRMNKPEGRKEICKTCAWDVELERRKQAMARVAAERVDIPARLVNHRMRCDLTQEQEAKRLGLPLGTYITYEQGRRGRRMSENLYRHIIEQTADTMDEPTTELTAGQKAARTRKRRVATSKAVKTR